jgi:hypothetical protein
MTCKRKIAQEYVAPRGPSDLISFYREIGISAVAAAYEATSGKPQSPVRNPVEGAISRSTASKQPSDPNQRVERLGAD